jgi:hypothetical protein
MQLGLGNSYSDGRKFCNCGEKCGVCECPVTCLRGNYDPIYIHREIFFITISKYADEKNKDSNQSINYKAILQHTINFEMSFCVLYSVSGRK